MAIVEVCPVEEADLLLIGVIHGSCEVPGARVTGVATIFVTEDLVDVDAAPAVGGGRARR
jgi:hypothetical protein